MFGLGKTVHIKPVSTPPSGISEIIFCVFDEKHRLHHHFRSAKGASDFKHDFSLLDQVDSVHNKAVFAEAVTTGKPVTVSFAYQSGFRKHLYLLPYQSKKAKRRLACLQVTTTLDRAGASMTPAASALSEDRLCLILTDPRNKIIAASETVPSIFGYSSAALTERHLADLFSSADVVILSSCAPDSPDPVLSGQFQCAEGGCRAVEVVKFSAPDGVMLYGICDIARPQLNEEIAQVSTRERRRIGQDLHDSIGQILTGVSLLSRSLANSLMRDFHKGSEDAAQISELADDASNQIRQISRGLMPSEVVERGLAASLQNLARITRDSCGLECDARIDASVDFHDGAIETHLFRIAQEAVNNAVRHSGASRIDISVAYKNGVPQLAVCDDGAWKEHPESSDGLGMKTMQYRASVIGGHLQIGTTKQGGTEVLCRLELDELMEARV